MEIFGKPTINSSLYFSGKLSAYVIWISMLAQIFGFNLRCVELSPMISLLSVVFAATGLVISVIAMFDLGSSLRFGIPSEGTEFKTGGLYRFSRNPIYLGFYILTASAMFYTFNPLTAVIGIYSLYVHHLITLSEEKFMEGRFGQKYLDYCKKTRRYI